MSKLPNVGVLVGENPEQELPVAVGDIGLRHDDVVARRQREERDDLSRDAVVRHVEWRLKMGNFHCQQLSPD